MNSNTLDAGPTVNVNMLMQDHLDAGGTLELVIRRGTTPLLNWHLTEAQTEQLTKDSEAK